jgi:hypothetical protein
MMDLYITRFPGGEENIAAGWDQEGLLRMPGEHISWNQPIDHCYSRSGNLPYSDWLKKVRGEDTPPEPAVPPGNLWVLVAESCGDCGSRGVAVYDHKPSLEEEQQAEKALGGMSCIRTWVTRAKLNTFTETKD